MRHGGYGSMDAPDGAGGARNYRPTWTRHEDNRLRELQQKRKATPAEITQSDICELADLERRSDFFLKQGLHSMEKELGDRGKNWKSGDHREEDTLGLVTRRLCWDVLLNHLHDESKVHAAALKAREARRRGGGRFVADKAAAGTEIHAANATVAGLAVLAGVMELAQSRIVTEDADAAAYGELKARVGALRMRTLDNAVATAGRVVDALLEADAGSFAATAFAPSDGTGDATQSVVRNLREFMRFDPPGAAAMCRERAPHSATVVSGSAVEAVWALPFPEELTREAVFHHPTAGELPCAMMHAHGGFAYAARDTSEQVCVLPLSDALDAVVVLPAASRSAIDCVESLAASWDAVVGAMHPVEGHVHLPRFDDTHVRDMSPALAACGCAALFAPERDRPRVLLAAHPCFITEAGVNMVPARFTNAGGPLAGATSGAASPPSSVRRRSATTSGGGGHVLDAAAAATNTPFSKERFEMRCDRPFVFLVRHARSGVVVSATVVGAPLPPGAAPPTAVALERAARAREAASLNAIFDDPLAAGAATTPSPDAASPAAKRRSSLGLSAPVRPVHSVFASPGGGGGGGDADVTSSTNDPGDLADFLGGSSAAGASFNASPLPPRSAIGDSASAGGGGADADFFEMLEGSFNAAEANAAANSSPSDASSPRVVATRKSRGRAASGAGGGAGASCGSVDPASASPAGGARVVASRRQRNSSMSEAAAAAAAAPLKTTSSFAFINAAAAVEAVDGVPQVRQSSFAFINSNSNGSMSPNADTTARDATTVNPASLRASSFAFVNAPVGNGAVTPQAGKTVVAARRKRSSTASSPDEDTASPVPSKASPSSIGAGGFGFINSTTGVPVAPAVAAGGAGDEARGQQHEDTPANNGGASGPVVVVARRRRGASGKAGAAADATDATAAASPVPSAFGFISAAEGGGGGENASVSSGPAAGVPQQQLASSFAFINAGGNANASGANLSFASSRSGPSNTSFLRFESPVKARPQQERGSSHKADDLDVLFNTPSAASSAPPRLSPTPNASAEILRAYAEGTSAADHHQQLQHQQAALSAQIAALQTQMVGLGGDEAAAAPPPTHTDPFTDIWKEAASGK